MAFNGKEKSFGPGLGFLATTQPEVSVGIDQSLTGFGLTIMSVEDPTRYETWVYKSSYNGVRRLVDIRAWLMSKIPSDWDCTITDVAMEGTVLASHSALVLGELSALVKLTLFDYLRMAPLQIPPMTLKKYASGKGTSKKQEMLMQIYKRYGVEFNDDNAADSYALARVAAGIHIDATEEAIIEQIKDPKYRDSLD